MKTRNFIGRKDFFLDFKKYHDVVKSMQTSMLNNYNSNIHNNENSLSNNDESFEIRVKKNPIYDDD